MKKLFIKPITLLVLLMGLFNINVTAQSDDPFEGYFAEKFPNVEPTARDMIALHASDLHQLRNNTLNRYRHTLQQFERVIIHQPSKSETKANVGPVLVAALTQELVGLVSKYAKIPGVTSIMKVFQAVDEEMERASAASRKFNTYEWIRDELDNIEDLKGENFERVIREELLTEYNALPFNSERTFFLEDLEEFQNQDIQALVPEIEEVELGTYVNFINAMQETNSEQGYVYFDVEMKNDDVEDWTSDDIASTTIGIEVPYGEKIADRLNEITRNAGVNGSPLRLNVVKSIIFHAPEIKVAGMEIVTLVPPQVVFSYDNSIVMETANSDLVSHFSHSPYYPYFGEYQ